MSTDRPILPGMLLPPRVDKVRARAPKAPATYAVPAAVTERHHANGRTWVPGAGPASAGAMLVWSAIRADPRSITDTAANVEHYGRWMGYMRHSGLNTADLYVTAIVKYIVGHETPKAIDVNSCMPLFAAELRTVRPRVAILVGTAATQYLFGNRYKITDYHGAALTHPEYPGTTFIPVYDLGYVDYSVNAEAELRQDLRKAARLQQGSAYVDPAFSYTVLHSEAEVSAAVDGILADTGNIKVGIDCEWHGDNWMDPRGYLRTVQFAVAQDHAYVYEIAGTGTDADEDEWHTLSAPALGDPGAFRHLRRLFNHPRVGLVGHNIIADGEWLLQYGLDVRPNTFCDTMLIEHLLNSDGDFDLNALVLKYTPYDKYDIPVVEWKRSVPSRRYAHGYGAIPREILLPYAAKDAALVLTIAEHQWPDLVAAGYTRTRSGYASAHRAALDTQMAIYEMQARGLLVDRPRLDAITIAYQHKRAEIGTLLNTEATKLGMPMYNPESQDQTRLLLFGKLGLQPIRATDSYGGMTWDRLIEEDPDVTAVAAAKADKRTLDILQDKAPAVKLLRHYRQLAQTCKTWLSDPVEHPDTGLHSKIWPDGAVHSQFSQLKTTNRLGSKKPNVQNFPKKAEGDFERVFGKGRVPPMVRSVFVPRPGYVFLEVDWKQAELFTLAGLSGDATMMGALVTPGKDLHDMTAVSSFGLIQQCPDVSVATYSELAALKSTNAEAHAKLAASLATKGVRPVSVEQLVELASADMPAHDELLAQMSYLTQRGELLSRKAFKDSIRVSAKNINFGIPYGRGAEDIALQVKGETGTQDTVETLTQQIAQIMDTWKHVMYRDAWAYMTACAQRVLDPGYVETPWGTRRHFRKTRDRAAIAGMQREAQNFPIQGTVAETCKIALGRLFDYRARNGLGFFLVNQIHDAILLEVPESQVAETKAACTYAMAEIVIPIPGRPLKLAVDMDLYSRWGEKVKKKAA